MRLPAMVPAAAPALARPTMQPCCCHSQLPLPTHLHIQPVLADGVVRVDLRPRQARRPRPRQGDEVAVTVEAGAEIPGRTRAPHRLQQNNQRACQAVGRSVLVAADSKRSGGCLRRLACIGGELRLACLDDELVGSGARRYHLKQQPCVGAGVRHISHLCLSLAIGRTTRGGNQEACMSGNDQQYPGVVSKRGVANKASGLPALLQFSNKPTTTSRRVAASHLSRLDICSAYKDYLG